MSSVLQSDQPAFVIKPELESKRGQRQRCLGVLLAVPASVAELSNRVRSKLDQDRALPELVESTELVDFCGSPHRVPPVLGPRGPVR